MRERAINRILDLTDAYSRKELESIKDTQELVALSYDVKKKQIMTPNLREKDLALITSIIINEDILGGTIFQTFDKAYALAEKFQDKFSHDFNWENQELDFDEAIILFTKNNL